MDSLQGDYELTTASFELVYKWFGLRENGRLNLCNPVHVGALAIAREIARFAPEDYIDIGRPDNLQELADMIVNRARRGLRIHITEDVDYRNPVHFNAVTCACREILRIKR